MHRALRAVAVKHARQAAGAAWAYEMEMGYVNMHSQPLLRNTPYFFFLRGVRLPLAGGRWSKAARPHKRHFRHFRGPRLLAGCGRLQY